LKIWITKNFSMSYSESIQKIRQARADRDAVKEKIYNLFIIYYYYLISYAGLKV